MLVISHADSMESTRWKLLWIGFKDGSTPSAKNYSYYFINGSELTFNCSSTYSVVFIGDTQGRSYSYNLAAK